MCLLVTFSQTTTCDTLKPDKDKNTIGAVAARCLAALKRSSPVQMDGPWPATFPEMLEDFWTAMMRVREVEQHNSIAACILLDEIMKVSCEQRRCILDEMTGAMQTDLSHGLPTFMLVTSPDAKPVVDVLQTSSQRPLAHVPLHGVTYRDAEQIAVRVHTFLVACRATALPAEEVVAANECGAAWRWLLH
eukprot:TRINITY_DN1053_c0_g2_i1.p1 TRINITY_DN1053_c0_g2~~TRINITY_DN1053_c0_g2_i1.p1  ORF type:complete len:190 (+),score=17.39 TRINITY_DN1053_c0_g2_i1:192-761(+)